VQTRHFIGREGSVRVSAGVGNPPQVRAIGADGGQIHVVVRLFADYAIGVGGGIRNQGSLGKMRGVKEKFSCYPETTWDECFGRVRR
jgi:hypothetical protein